jgi:AraC-like DNA-binding protein
VKRFAKEVVKKTGDELLFYDSAPIGFRTFRSTVAAKVLGRNVTVFERIKRLVEIASKASSVLSWSIRTDDDLIWIVRTANEPVDEELWYFEQFAIGVFETAITDALGNRARPKVIKLRSDPEQYQIPKQWRDISIIKRQNFSGIAYQTQILSSERLENMSGVRFDVGGKFDADILLNLTDAIFLFDNGWGHGLEIAAEAFGIERRTFQRRLAEIGLTYSGIVEEVRYRRALEMIQSGGTTMSDVAAEAGFNSASNFSRAFRRRFGVAPSKYFALQATDS